MERRKPAAIDRATALRYMGASGWTPDAATAALLDKAEQTVLTAAAPQGRARRSAPAGSHRSPARSARS